MQQLKFSNEWIKLFLTHGGVTRRKMTREDKAAPSDEEIHKTLQIRQKCYVDGGLTYAIGIDLCNGDLLQF